MQRQYDFITSHPFADVLAYYKGGRPVNIKAAVMVGQTLFINGQNAHGWTFCLKVQKPCKTD